VQVPNDFLCPLSMEIFKDPVIALDGHTYEREMIQKWFNQDSSLRSPKTNKLLEQNMLIPNHTLKIVIEDWKQKTHFVDPNDESQSHGGETIVFWALTTFVNLSKVGEILPHLRCNGIIDIMAPLLRRHRYKLSETKSSEEK